MQALAALAGRACTRRPAEPCHAAPKGRYRAQPAGLSGRYGGVRLAPPRPFYSPFSLRTANPFWAGSRWVFPERCRWFRNLSLEGSHPFPVSVRVYRWRSCPAHCSLSPPLTSPACHTWPTYTAGGLDVRGQDSFFMPILLKLGTGKLRPNFVKKFTLYLLFVARSPVVLTGLQHT